MKQAGVQVGRQSDAESGDEKYFDPLMTTME
jgi:hypothetical protein